MPSALQLKTAFSVSKLHATRSQTCVALVGALVGLAIGLIEHLHGDAFGGFNQADPGVGRIQQRQARGVSGLKTRRIEFDRRRWTRDPAVAA